MEAPFEKDTFTKTRSNKLEHQLAKAALATFKRKMDKLAVVAYPVIKQVYEKQGQQYENILIPITDGKRMFNIPVNLKAAYESEGKEVVKAFEKAIMLLTIDEAWKEHLRELDDLRQSVQNASYEQKDPLVIYKIEAFKLFQNMLSEVNKEIASFLFKGQLPQPDSRQQAQATQQAPQQFAKRMSESRGEIEDGSGAQQQQQHQAPQQAPPREKTEPVRVGPKVGRNDPCPCGSGKKFKSCHGKDLE